MAGYTPEDFDYAVRTVYGEARGEPVLGQQAVAAVIKNRARAAKTGFKNVVLAPNQFEPWSTKRDQLMSLSPQSPEYQRIAASIQGIFDGDADPTNGATHFYSPKVQAALGRKPPSWDNGNGFDIGTHRFFKLGGPVPAAPNSTAQPSPASAPITTGSIPGSPPMADFSTSGLSPEEVALRRRYGQQAYQQASDASPVGHWTQALARVVQGANAGMWNSQAQTGETEGRQAMVNAIMSGNPKAVLGTPYGASMAPQFLEQQMRQSDPMYQAQLTAARETNTHNAAIRPVQERVARIEADIKQRELDAPPLKPGVSKDGEVPNVYDARTGQFTFFQPPGFQPPAEKKRMEERVQLEEKDRAKALATANEADEMAREVRAAMGHIVSDGTEVGPDGKPIKTYGDAPAKVFGTTKDGKPLKYKVSPEIFGPFEASGVNTNLQAGSPMLSSALDYARGGRSVPPDERNRQRGVLAARLQSLNAVMTKAQNEGQGAVTNYEREMYAQAVADMKSGDVTKAYSILTDLQNRFIEKAKAARSPYLQDTRPALVPPPNSAAAPSVRSPAPQGPVSTPSVRGANPGTQPPPAPQKPAPATAEPAAAPAPEQPQPAQTQKADFRALPPAAQREGLMRLAKNFDNPAYHKGFIDMFGADAYEMARSKVEKLRKGIAF